MHRMRQEPIKSAPPTLPDGTVDLFARRRDQAGVRRTVGQIDTMLGQYTRAQLITAGLSAAFYRGSMAPLKLPYPWRWALPAARSSSFQSSDGFLPRPPC